MRLRNARDRVVVVPGYDRVHRARRKVDGLSEEGGVRTPRERDGGLVVADVLEPVERNHLEARSADFERRPGMHDALDSGYQLGSARARDLYRDGRAGLQLVPGMGLRSLFFLLSDISDKFWLLQLRDRKSVV